MQKKKNIVAEAYRKPNNIKTTARAYLIYPKAMLVLDGAMFLVFAMLVEIPRPAGTIFDSEAVVDENNCSPGPLSKKLLNLKACLKNLFFQLAVA